MKLHEIKDIITAQREEIGEKFEKEKIIEREVNREELRKFLGFPNILAILGVRRCGKSVLSVQIFQKNFAYINFDDERFVEIEAKDLNKILEAFYELYGKVENIILDEPQRVKGWELFANRLRRTKRLIITGSNSQLLSGELATALTGRHIQFTLFPFSFSEFLKYNEFDIGELYSLKIAEIKKMLKDYIRAGGFPEVNRFGREILLRIYGDMIEKDILKRIRIKKKDALKEFIKYLVTNSAKEFSIRKTKNILEVRDVHTLRNWLGFLENAYLGFVLKRYSPKLKEQMISPKKFYCIDTGLANTISFRISEDFGRLMENLVAVELMRRRSYRYGSEEIYYWKDYRQHEVDFVIKNGVNIKQLIQVTCMESRDEIERREIRALLKAGRELKCRNLLVITWDYEGEETSEGRKIKFVPLWRWLLDL